MSDTAQAVQPRWRTLLVPGLSALVAFAILVGLGLWQLERKAWKEALIARLEQRLAATPMPLPPRERWPALTADADEFRRVSFRAAFASDQAWVFAAGSALRSDASGPGYWVFAPARLADGGVVVVNRGFVPGIERAPLPPSQTAAPVEMVGVLRWPEPRGLFAPADEPLRNLWYLRDHRPMAAARRWGEVAPFYVELESPQPPEGVPRAGKLKINLRNDHLQYALTWFALAAVLLAVFGVWARGRVRIQ